MEFDRTVVVEIALDTTVVVKVTFHNDVLVVGTKLVTHMVVYTREIEGVGMAEGKFRVAVVIRGVDVVIGSGGGVVDVETGTIDEVIGITGAFELDVS